MQQKVLFKFLLLHCINISVQFVHDVYDSKNNNNVLNVLVVVGG